MGAKIKVAVIGAGGWGYQHARVFSSRSDTELCAVVGRTDAKTKERAELFKVPYYLDIREMLGKEKPDFVSICMPGQQTFKPTMQVIEAGIPLLVEKPLAYDLKEAQALIDEAEKRKLFFAINFNHRYSRAVQMASRDIRSGKAGDIIFALWRFGHGSGDTLSHPHVNLIEAQCHGFDMLEYLCGPIASVMAEMTDKTNKGGYGTIALSLSFKNGAVGSFLGTFDASSAYPLSQFIEINGSKGRIVVEDTVRKYSFQEKDTETANVWQADFFNDHDRQFTGTFDNHADEIIKALVENREPPVHAGKGLRALQLAYAAIDSFERGVRVSI